MGDLGSGSHLRLLSRRWSKLRSSKGLTHELLAGGSGSRHVGFSTGLLECPQDMGVPCPRVSHLREREMEATLSFMTQTWKSPSMTPTWLHKSALLGGKEVHTNTLVFRVGDHWCHLGGWLLSIPFVLCTKQMKELTKDLQFYHS